ncbi:MAG: pyridoxal-phosphate dependent enzyme [Patescibacteria group bacterium]|nr:pyridoxal-phosphate dependent enzyme [Patescibacteria group bacterium]
MEDFDHRQYRDHIAKELRDTPRKTTRQRKLRIAQATSEYGHALQMHRFVKGVELPTDRQALYDELAEEVGDTPLVEHEDILPNGNRLFVKQEFENGVGHSHYDRVYLRLFEEKERLGIIKPGDTVLETTSGTAGVSFAEMGRRLGYRCEVAIPADGEKPREEAIEAAGARLHMTPPELYVNGFKPFLNEYLKEHANVVFINHSMGNILGAGSDVNENAVQTMHAITDEIERDLPMHEALDVVILSAVGNGTNTLGITERFREIAPETRVVAYEPFSAGVAFEEKYGKEVREEMLAGFKAEDFSRHRHPGQAFAGIEFAAIKQAAKLVADVREFADSKTVSEFEGSGRDLPEEVVRTDIKESERQDMKRYGRSTITGIDVAKKLAETESGKLFVVIGYDTRDRYDI